MAAITWQNINGPSLADAGRPMEAASRSFNGMFDGLSAVLKQREATQNANWDQTKTNNTNAMFGAIQEAGTPEDYAARESQLRQQLTGYGAQIDSVAVRNAMDSRLATLQGRATANQQFTDQRTDIAQRPVLAGYQGALAQAKTPEDVQGLMASMQAASGAGAIDPRAFTSLMKDALGRNTNLVTDSRTAAMEADRLSMAPLDRAAKESATRAAIAQAEASGIQSQVLQGKLEDDRATRAALLNKASFDARLEGTTYKGGELTGNNAQELYDVLKNNNSIDDGEKAKVMSLVTRLQSEGGVDVSHTVDGKTITEKLPIPKEMLKSILMGAQDKGWLHAWNNSPADFVEETLKKAMNKTHTVNGTERNDTVDGFTELLLARKAAIDNPTASGAKGGSTGPKASGDYKSPKFPKPAK